MTKQMYEEYVKQLSKRAKGLTIAVVVLAILLFVVTVICVADFEIAVEYSDNYNVEQSADGFGGGENAYIQQSGITAKNHETAIICTTVVAALIVIVAGVLIYAYISKKDTELQCEAISQFRKGNVQSLERAEQQESDDTETGTDQTMTHERLTRNEVDDYCANAGLTALQKEILKLRFFDESEPTVTEICIRLHISESKFYRNQRKLLSQIYKYEQRF